MANDNMKHRRLQELGESDFEIVEGQPDIRGWDVKDASGETIGEVEELILDAQARKVRYMVVELDDDALDLEDDRTVLIPIGIAQLHEDDDDVLLQNVTVEQLKQLPEYDEDNLDEEVERAICTSLGRNTTTSGTGAYTHDSAFYEHEHFNDVNLYQRRLPQSTSGDLTGERNNMQFRERNSLGNSDNLGGLAPDSDQDDSRRFTQENSYSGAEVEEDSLLSVNRDRRDTDINSLMDDDSDSGVERDTERRNREGRRDTDPIL